jgi:predicted O-linked N-acetylglucosamine transferase (SPINDLY family)
LQDPHTQVATKAAFVDKLAVAIGIGQNAKMTKSAMSELFALAANHCQSGHFEMAEQLYKQLIQLEPDNADANFYLANTLIRLQKYNEAIAQYRRVLQLRPDHTDAHYILGLALQQQGGVDEAVPHFVHALQLNPNHADAHNSLGLALMDQGRLDEAVPCFQRAMQLKPRFAFASNNLGVAYLKQGRADLAQLSFQDAVRCDPALATAQSNYLFSLNYDPRADLDVIFLAHRRWGESKRAATVRERAGAQESAPSRSRLIELGNRPLRIGYISPDFRAHPLCSYFEPVLANHDREQFQVFCYAEVAAPDHFTERLQKLVSGWYWTCNKADADVAQRIRDDGIDILVDLAGHTANNRLGVLAHKPAPVQATWLGYLNTTGLTTVDYRLTDDVLDPLGKTAVRDTEQLWRLPNGMCCFEVLVEAPELTPLPALDRGYVTFGSVHNLFKLNPFVFDLWSRVLDAVPTAHLLVFRDMMTESCQAYLRRQFQERGINSNRLELRRGLSGSGYLGIFNEIDISLDTFPCTGGVTTCESLWMGVPVLTLCGVRPVSRNSAALLTRVGLHDWIANTPEQYAAIAASWARNLNELARLRLELRERTWARLCDAKRFTRELEHAYRAMCQRSLG